MKKEATAKELEAHLMKIEAEFKKNSDEMRIKYRDEIKRLRSAIANRKRQEKVEMRKDVGEYFIRKFERDGNNPDMDTEDYYRWIDKLVQCYNSKA